MIIGNAKTFAIQYEFNEDTGGEWLFGKICYWIDAIKVGDYDLGASLRDVLLQSEYILRSCGKRQLSFFNESDVGQLFNTIDNQLYGDGSVVLADLLSIDEVARFDVTVPVDVYFEWKIFLFDLEGFSLLLFKNENDDAVRSCRLSINEFDSVFKELYFQLDKALT
jgi:Immunity protein 42